MRTQFKNYYLHMIDSNNFCCFSYYTIESFTEQVLFKKNLIVR